MTKTMDKTRAAFTDRATSLLDAARELYNVRYSEAVRHATDELERLDMTQVDEDERQPWTFAYKQRVASIIDNAFRNFPNR